MMTKTLLTLILAFAAVFGAGAMIGTARHRGEVSGPHAPNGRDGWLSRELNLTAEQREQMRAIWSQVMSPDNGKKLWDERRELQEQREQTIRQMLSDAQKQELDQINAEFDQKLARLDESRRETFRQAVAQTRAMLNQDQAAKYDEFLKRRGKGGGPRPFGKLDSPATAPAGDR